MNNARKLKEGYLNFFQKRNHRLLPNSSLIPENDPTTLFISAGMQPLVPYLLGEPHPLGKRLVSLQRCLRTGDIDSVGDVSHNTFFEMLGNWSLGDYWKKESLSWSLEFLTSVLDFEKTKLSVTIFGGDRNALRDEESEKIWLSLGIPRERIYPFGRDDNWWEAGNTGPGGPDSEIFYDTGKVACGASCRPGDNCGRFFEVWNNVFMEYNRKKDGTYEKLHQRNVDTGMGVERTLVVLNGLNDSYQTEVFVPIIRIIEQTSGKLYKDEKNKKPMRIIADHSRAAVFLIADGILPGNVEQGYILRRLIRRAVRQGKTLGITGDFISEMTKTVIDIYGEDYPDLLTKKQSIIETVKTEEEKFGKTLARGLREIEKHQRLDGKTAFYLYESYGFPLEVTEEIAGERGQKIDKKIFEEEFFRHQRTSRAGAGKKFSGGLADHSEKVTNLHTATHLLHRALRDVLGENVNQAGSNITEERLRFDFTCLRKLTSEEIKRVEKTVNEKIADNLSVKMEITTLSEAKKRGATALFTEKYGEKVKVYSIGDPSAGSGQAYSCEVCGGPHAENTKSLGEFSIIKEEAAGAGKRRIYAKLL
ncbi:MAG: alanine--tRNA ligase [bacterium]|nr:alanine--tRNA ligase [bacterium]